MLHDPKYIARVNLTLKRCSVLQPLNSMIMFDLHLGLPHTHIFPLCSTLFWLCRLWM